MCWLDNTDLYLFWVDELIKKIKHEADQRSGSWRSSSLFKKILHSLIVNTFFECPKLSVRRKFLQQSDEALLVHIRRRFYILSSDRNPICCIGRETWKDIQCQNYQKTRVENFYDFWGRECIWLGLGWRNPRLRIDFTYNWLIFMN